MILNYFRCLNFTDCQGIVLDSSGRIQYRASPNLSFASPIRYLTPGRLCACRRCITNASRENDSQYFSIRHYITVLQLIFLVLLNQGVMYFNMCNCPACFGHPQTEMADNCFSVQLYLGSKFLFFLNVLGFLVIC